MKESDGKNIFFIRDNGVGFSMDDVQNLFTPFQRLRGIESITGFGYRLSYCGAHHTSTWRGNMG
jgi:C4-dicarboxylate-specific signal transduction histidine kinase